MRKTKVASYILLGFIILLSIALAIVFDLPFFDLAVAITGVIYVAVLSERSIFNFLFGLINAILYVILSFNTKLYGEAILYLVFDIPVSVIAFFSWKKVIRKDFTVPARNLHVVWLFILPIALGSLCLFIRTILKAHRWRVCVH